MLLSLSFDQTARLWSIPRGQPLGPPLWRMATGQASAWSDDARHLAPGLFLGIGPETNVDESHPSSLVQPCGGIKGPIMPQAQPLPADARDP
jgi:hypothetical protein